MTSCWSLKQKIFPIPKRHQGWTETISGPLFTPLWCSTTLSTHLPLCPSVSITFRCKMNEGIDHFNIYLEWESLWWYTLLLKTWGEEVTNLQNLHPAFTCAIKELENIKETATWLSEWRYKDSCFLSTSTWCCLDFHSSFSTWSTCCSLRVAIADRSWCITGGFLSGMKSRFEGSPENKKDAVFHA